MPMVRPPEDDLYFNFFKANHTTKYLESYVDSHRFAGQTLRDRIKFACKVKAITKAEGVWLVQCDIATFRATKVIIASGLSSTPSMPDLPGKDNFEVPVIHQEDFGRSSVLSSPDYQNVTVLGAGKSAADMVYASVKAGKSVSWVLRTSGTGPASFFSPKGKGPYKNGFEFGATRMAGTLSLSIFAPDTWWTRFVNGNKYGQKIVNALWSTADKATLDLADYDGRHNALEGFQNLKPLTP